jgi:hypothetical protein
MLQRNTTVLAISSGVPTAPKGVVAAAWCLHLSDLLVSQSKLVFIAGRDDSNEPRRDLAALEIMGCKSGPRCRFLAVLALASDDSSYVTGIEL